MAFILLHTVLNIFIYKFLSLSQFLSILYNLLNYEKEVHDKHKYAMLMIIIEKEENK